MWVPESLLIHLLIHLSLLLLSFLSLFSLFSLILQEKSYNRGEQNITGQNRTFPLYCESAGVSLKRVVELENLVKAKEKRKRKRNVRASEEVHLQVKAKPGMIFIILSLLSLLLCHCHSHCHCYCSVTGYSLNSIGKFSSISERPHHFSDTTCIKYILYYITYYIYIL